MWLVGCLWRGGPKAWVSVAVGGCGCWSVGCWWLLSRVILWLLGWLRLGFHSLAPFLIRAFGGPKASCPMGKGPCKQHMAPSPPEVLSCHGSALHGSGSCRLPAHPHLPVHVGHPWPYPAPPHIEPASLPPPSGWESSSWESPKMSLRSFRAACHVQLGISQNVLARVPCPCTH